MTKVRVTLMGPGGELDHAEFEDKTFNGEMHTAIHATIADWILQPGDSITIEEVE